MNCITRSLALLDGLADAADTLLLCASPGEYCLDPSMFEVDGDAYRALDIAMAKLQEFEEV
jgi:hypothetical protein